MTRLAALLLLLPACVVHYKIGDETTTCPSGQVMCGDQCSDSCPDTETSVDTNNEDSEQDTPTTTDTCDGECPPPCSCDPLLEICTDDTCACRPSLTRCGATCVDLRRDPAHCGECDNSCDGGVCQNSACREACAGDLSDCDGACVEIKQDSLHCGDCATVCAPDEVCLAGTCRSYTAADDCDACPCDACDGLPCCPSRWLDAPVCVPDECGGD